MILKKIKKYIFKQQMQKKSYEHFEYAQQTVSAPENIHNAKQFQDKLQVPGKNKIEHEFFKVKNFIYF